MSIKGCKWFIKAFSMVEFLLVLSIFGILLLVVMPLGKGLFERNRAEAYTDGMRAGLRFARATAIKLGERVKFCGSKEHKECDGLWEEGQIIITSSNNGANKVYRVLPKVFAGDRLVWDGNFRKRGFVEFLPTGFTNGQKGSFYYCPGKGEENALAIILESTGRVRISHKTEDGRAISCF